MQQFQSIKLASEPLRTPLEQFVSEHTGRKWTIAEARDMAEFACHPAAILSDGSYSVFAKFSEAANGLEQFEIELAGLRFLSERSGVLIPSPVGILQVAGGSILVLETVQAVERGPRHWRQIGQALGRIHQNKGERMGLDRNGYIGPIPMDNTPADNWAAFYTERRLLPLFRLAIDSGNLPADMARQVELVASRIPRLAGPEPIPTLLHGDAQQNNFISTERGAVMIDPAMYYGNPEMDLAFIGMWQGPIPEDVFEAYQEEQPIEPDFQERIDLWRIWGYLAGVALEGPIHLPRLSGAVRKYL